MKIRGFRWWIAGLLLLASILNYLDRNTVSVLAPSIQRDLDISDQQYAHVMSFFMIAYTIAYLCSGFSGIVDPIAVILTGFSRGQIAMNYIGFRDDRIAYDIRSVVDGKQVVTVAKAGLVFNPWSQPVVVNGGDLNEVNFRVQ